MILQRSGLRRCATNFPIWKNASQRPDPPALCHATVRAAVAAARRSEPALPLIAGGKSFGGRMTSQAQAAAPLQGVCGLAFLGFPLHPPKQPSDTRGEHLMKVHIPMLFLQGTRDAFAELPLLEALAGRLGTRARLVLLADADHSFHVPARSGRTDPEVQGRNAAGTRRVDEIDHPVRGRDRYANPGPAAERDDASPTIAAKDRLRSSPAARSARRRPTRQPFDR